MTSKKNSYLASEAYSINLYGSNHPYATFISEEEINDVTLYEVKDFHATNYQLGKCHVFLTGDISLKAKELITKSIEEDMTSSNETPQYTDIKRLTRKSNIVQVKTKNDLQAAIRVGNEVISPTHSDFPALYYTTHLLGGYFGSRLMKNIREDKGFTYGIYASLSLREHSTMFTIGTEVKGNTSKETLSEIERELDRLRHEPIPEDEMHTVLKHLSGKFISDEATLFDQMDRYKSTVFLKLPPDYYHTLVQSFIQMSPKKVLEVSTRYLKKENLLTVIAGGL